MTGRSFTAGLLSVLGSVVLIIVILLTSVDINAFNLKFFEKEYEKLNVAQNIGISQSELMDVTVGLLNYIQAERDDLKMRATIKGTERQVFNQKEIDHMVDVQKLYLNAKSVRNMGLVILLVFMIVVWWLAGKRAYQYWAKGYLAGVGFVFVILGAILFVISRDFLWFWHRFHEVFFTNDLWLLNPQTDILIQMVPEQFFFDLVLRILVFTIVSLTILALLSLGFLRRSRMR